MCYDNPLYKIIQMFLIPNCTSSLSKYYLLSFHTIQYFCSPSLTDRRLKSRARFGLSITLSV